MSSYGVPDRGPASSPALAPKPLQPVPQQPQSQEGVTVRPMRLKVLYTFDDQNKTNCLARWAPILDVRTAYLDESQQIGVIELKTCLQAIVSASPELVAKLGQDYTVYAYDYSEYETPLVGQGMLSWILASSSSTPSAPAHQSKTMVTGRVCKNILGLFSSNSHETLEVKLRLVPVPSALQSEYIENMKKYSEISKMMPAGFDPGAWASFIQANPAIMQLANPSRSQTPTGGPTQREGVGIEHVQRLLSQAPTAFQSGDLPLGPQPATSATAPTYAQYPRPSSPASSVQSNPGPKRRGRPPKNASKPRTNSSNVQRKQAARPDTVENGYGSNDDRLEEGTSKKRAKITKADVPDHSAFGQQPESLRVAASTAASLRIHQPSAVRPSLNLASSLEAPPRAPTPIANPHDQVRRPTLPTARSSLRQESLVTENSTYESPYAPSEPNAKPPESAVTSPEASRADSSGETPADISSSPPVYRGISTAPSSPRLPLMPRDVDSGFMSGSIDDLFEDDECRPIDEEDIAIAAQYSKRSDLPSLPVSQTKPLDPHRAETQAAEVTQPDDKAIALSRQHARNAVGLGRTASSGDLSRPSAAACDPIRPSGLYRSQSWAGHQNPPPTSDMSHPDESDAHAQNRPTKRIRRGSRDEAQIKKAKIQSKLATSIAAGEMPPFCDHCGAIETPTWRKAWVKLYSGTPEHVRVSDEEGGILAWQTLQTDESGTVCLYRVFKKSLLNGDEGFKEVLLCNPCGLYLHKRKCMRPKENWEKVTKDRDGKRRRPTQPKSANLEQNHSHPASDATQGHGTGHSGSSSPIPGATDGAGDKNNSQMVPQLPVNRKTRALSVQLSPVNKKGGLAEASAALALKRAIQSSPVRVVGTQCAPIQVEELTPKPTRRILFPSPGNSDTPKSAGMGRASAAEGSESGKSTNCERPDPIAADPDDKENCPPPPEDESDFAFDQLFHEHLESATRPTTPTPSGKLQNSSMLKTPNHNGTPNRLPPTTGDFFSSTAKALLQNPRTPKRSSTISGTLPLGDITPFTAHMNQLFSEANESPSANFDFPSLPSLRNTPGGSGHNFDFSNLDSQDFFSTDAPMPSSPPVWFGVYEDPVDNEAGTLFSDYQAPNDATSVDLDANSLTSKTPKTPGLIVDERGRASVDFSATA